MEFAYSKETMDLRDAYNQQIDKVISLLEKLKIQNNDFDIRQMQI